MTILRALRALLLGETWMLPLGVACVLLAAAPLRTLAPSLWETAGGFLLLGAVAVVLWVSVSRGR